VTRARALLFALALALAACAPPAEPPIVLDLSGATAPLIDPYRFGEGGATTDQRPGARPAQETDEGGLWMRMDRVEQDLRTSGNLVRDPELNTYVQGLVCALAGPYCSDIRSYVMRLPAFNASMAPNGVMQVWTGLLVRCRDEAQLAAVIGHEIGHYVRRHSMQLWRDARDKTDFLVFFQIAIAAARVPFVTDVVTYGVIGSIYAFGRDAEREADRIGLALMARAGYDPAAVPAIWRQVVREDEADRYRAFRTIYFATHPTPRERLETLDLLARGTRTERRESGAERYRAIMKPRRLDWLRDELALRRFDRMEILLATLVEDEPAAGDLRYMQGEVYRLRGDPGDEAKALDAFRAAAAAEAPPAETHRSLGLVLRRTGERAAADAAFADYLRLKPAAEDRAMIEALIGEAP